MELVTFIESLNKKSDFLAETEVIAFHGDHYPLFFFSLLFERLSKTVPIQPISCVDEPLALFAQLQTSFLGQSNRYWLKNIDQLRNEKKLKIFVKEYKGPHTLILFSKKVFFKNQDKKISIIIPPRIGPDVIKAFCSFMKIELSASLLTLLHKKVLRLTLDRICLIVLYSMLLGNKSARNHTFLLKLTQMSPSLFTLSQYFFARNSAQFFSLWSLVYKDYNEVFWIWFWAEQVWRALFYIHYSQQKKLINAKAVAHRLPFSFLNKDWRKHTTVELQKAHQFLYSIDFSFKNGAACSYALDLFHSKFFLKNFC